MFITQSCSDSQFCKGKLNIKCGYWVRSMETHHYPPFFDCHKKIYIFDPLYNLILFLRCLYFQCSELPSLSDVLWHVKLAFISCMKDQNSIPFHKATSLKLFLIVLKNDFENIWLVPFGPLALALALSIDELFFSTRRPYILPCHHKLHPLQLNFQSNLVPDRTMENS